MFTTWDELQRLRPAIDDEFAAMVAAANAHLQLGINDAAKDISHAALPLVYSPGLGAAEIREQSMLLRAESSAGSLILMLDDIIQRLRHCVWDSSTKFPYASDFTLGALQGSRGHVATAIYAGGNAYRHAKDWIGLVNAKGTVDKAQSQFRQAEKTMPFSGR